MTRAEEQPTMKASSYLPYDPAPALYIGSGGTMRLWEYNGWKAESMSWKTGCYIHAGLSRMSKVYFRGPDALKFLSYISINGYTTFPINTGKHMIMCNENGLIVRHGVLERLGEEEFINYGGEPWASYQFKRRNYNAKMEDVTADRFLFQIAGPTSLETLEAATGESLRDIGFMGLRKSSVHGMEVEVLRMGMAGSLAYELHGRTQDAPSIYEAVVQAGERYDIQRLGWRTYTVNHVEGGFPQSSWTFATARGDPDYEVHAQQNGIGLGMRISGSYDPANLRARYRTPVEVGWKRMINFDHDFIGRRALEEEVANPKRTVRTLVWNTEDVVDVYASQFKTGEEYKYIDMPTAPHLLEYQAHADEILRDGKLIGVASGATYSYYFRQMISLATIDLECSAIGTDVIVRWGDHGKRIKEIRARVERFPYLDLPRNQVIDVSRLPVGAPSARTH
jgi:vanillate/3-O-methylgallate O-demethylase